MDELTEAQLEECAQTAWAAYAEAVGGTAYDGKPLPNWGGLGDRQREGWRAATKAALEKAWELAE